MIFSLKLICTAGLFIFYLFKIEYVLENMICKITSVTAIKDNLCYTLFSKEELLANNSTLRYMYPKNHFFAHRKVGARA